MAHYQVRLKKGGPWHRPMLVDGVRQTACGEPLSGAYVSRDHELDDQLCQLCYTKRERDTGEMMKLERDAIEEAEHVAYGDDVSDTDLTPTDPDLDRDRKDGGD